ncbi:L-serine dehydratase, beta subunit / L-serine dehydratase, alpha subunit, partial [hydrothermal vent metagenome]
MECISIFDMLKIGIGPSSSHTLGPWRAAERWINHLKKVNLFNKITAIKVDLYGSLSLTGKGHASDLAILLGLSGYDPEYIKTNKISFIVNSIQKTKKINFGKLNTINFNPDTSIVFNKEFLPFHPNGITFTGFQENIQVSSDTYYSIGGGFVVRSALIHSKENIKIYRTFPFPIQTAKELETYCKKEQLKISEIVLKNEKSLRTESEIDHEIKRIWNVMLESMYTGCHTEGTLPGGLNVRRRAFDINKKLIGNSSYYSSSEWIKTIRNSQVKFRQI